MAGSKSRQSTPQQEQQRPRQPLPDGPQPQDPPQQQDPPPHMEQQSPSPAPSSASSPSPIPPGPSTMPARRFQPCIHCVGVSRLMEFFLGGLIYTMSDVAQVCRCGRTFYLYDCLVVAVDSELTFSKETGFYKTAIGLHFAPNSTHNFSKLIDRKEVDDPEDPPPYMDVKEQTERNAGISGILAAIDVIVALKLRVSKIVIKTHSAIFVKSMTEQWQPNAGVNNSIVLVAHQAYFLEAQKAMDKAAALGIEVVFWLVGFEHNDAAFAMAKAALYAKPAEDA